MIIEVRIQIELPDVEHTDQDITNFVKSKYGLHFLKRSNPFFAKADKQLSVGWEYEDVKPELIEAK
jgi:hypothetical protein